MEWFGWLLKPRMQVSLLDSLIGLSELLGLLAIILIISGIILAIKEKFDKK